MPKDKTLTVPLTPANSKVILVIQAGWVLCGVIRSQGEGYTTLDNASVIRRWGTTRGLGQLAIEGKTNETVLDPCGTAIVPNHAILWTLPVQDISDLL